MMMMARTAKILCVVGLMVGVGVALPAERTTKVHSISWRDMPPDPVYMGTAKPDLVHKFAWALPGVLGQNLVERLETVHGYDRNPLPAAKVEKHLRIDGGSGSLLEKGRKTLSVHQRAHAVTKGELSDAK